MAEFILLVMAIAAAAYVVLGGADFGAGMIEPMLPRRQHERVEAAIAPVWEANHVWLVLVAVLAFVGFPRLYTEVLIHLHVPVMLVLLGIVGRGAAFTFRHYDPEPGRLRPLYSTAFRVSSFMTPLFLGITAASLVDGRIGGCQNESFSACYLAPWNTWFTWATGFFLCALFAFQGCALLAAELSDGVRPALPYLRLTRRLHAATIASGGLVFAAAYATDSPFIRLAGKSVIGVAAVAAATLLVPVVAFSFHRGRPQLLRLSMAAQTLAIMVGFFAPGYPILVRMADGHHVEVASDAAPEVVLRQLAIAVVVGLLLILPSLVYLIAVYKRRRHIPEKATPEPSPGS